MPTARVSRPMAESAEPTEELAERPDSVEVTTKTEPEATTTPVEHDGGKAKATVAREATKEMRKEATNGSYVLPVVHTHVPAQAVEWGFWGGLAGAAVLGVVDPPLALLVGAGVVIARHRRS